MGGYGRGRMTADGGERRQHPATARPADASARGAAPAGRPARWIAKVRFWRRLSPTAVLAR